MGCKREKEAPLTGDEEARELLTLLYKKGHNLADYIIEQILGEQIGRDEREDLIHDGFVRLIRHARTLKNMGMEERMSYLHKAMRSVALDYARKLSQKKTQGVADENDIFGGRTGGLTPEELYLKKERAQDVSGYLYEALSRLTPRDCELLVEKYRDKRSDREIGARLGIRTEQVRVYIARARKRLAAFYREEEARQDPGRQAREKSRPRRAADAKR